MKNKNLKSRIQEYVNYLDEEIKDMKGIIENESMMGAVAAEKERDIYIRVRDKFYELFPELHKNEALSHLPYDNFAGMFEPLESRSRISV